MLICAGYDITLMANVPTPTVAMLNVHPSRRSDLRSCHEIKSNRSLHIDNVTDVFGNVCSRFIVPAGETTLSCDFIIEDCGKPDRQTPTAAFHCPTDLPADVMIYLLGSRYCETDRLSDVAWSLFGWMAPGWDMVQAIVDYTHHHLIYGYQYARATRTAWEGHQEGVGVCRDFAHLAIALCRCMNIPARYCSGYLGDIGIDPIDVPMDFHAWFEVYLGGSWHSFDARHRVPRIGRILMACGRDAADTPLTTSFGPVGLTSFKVHTDEVADCQRVVLAA